MPAKKKPVKTRSKSSSFSRGLIVILNVIIVCALLVFGGYFFAEKYFERSGLFQNDRVVQITEGAGLNKVAEILVGEGVINSALAFKLGAYYHEVENDMKAGEFEIPSGASIKDILDLLTDGGKAIQYKVTFPEGLTSWEIVQRLNATEGLTGEITEIPPEGSIAPSTYNFERGDDRQAILDLAMAYQNRFLEDAWNNRVDGLPLNSPEEMLILASIVEKETGNAEERPVVAAVFVNRLKQGMKLQTDPTVIYGITLGREKLGRGIRRSELRAETPYNTYVIEGLPPTPIANPGKASLDAVSNPANSDYIFFVAKTLNPADGHLFAETLAEHNANVAKYRALEAQANSN